MQCPVLPQNAAWQYIKCLNLLKRLVLYIMISYIWLIIIYNRCPKAVVVTLALSRSVQEENYPISHLSVKTCTM